MQQNVSQKLEFIFPNSKVVRQGDALKVHTENLNNSSITLLAALVGDGAKVEVKRSGTGITVIVT